mmetsp:Transcript_30203/g.66996  ORF Transcript_30203/g.66996 Transcript_30203/m.66996 type:complete len:207 (-) Transcript_30203:2878-3498(-)
MPPLPATAPRQLPRPLQDLLPAAAAAPPALLVVTSLPFLTCAERALTPRRITWPWMRPMVARAEALHAPAVAAAPGRLLATMTGVVGCTAGAAAARPAVCLRRWRALRMAMTWTWQRLRVRAWARSMTLPWCRRVRSLPLLAAASLSSRHASSRSRTCARPCYRGCTRRCCVRRGLSRQRRAVPVLLRLLLLAAMSYTSSRSRRTP